MFHRSGKDDLRFGLSEMLQLPDKVIELGRRPEQNFDEHGVIARNAIALHHIHAGADIGIKLLFLNGFHFQIDKGLDVKPERLRIDVGVVPLSLAVFFQLFNPGGNRRRR